MTRILKAAIQHRGFAFVEMLQACPTYNHFATHEYLLDRYFDANAEGHDPGNLQQAKTLATQFRIASPAAFSINAKTFRTSMTG
jgi:2-oxoglutarate ferredoxin oxidoreductase subunit beta